MRNKRAVVLMGAAVVMLALTSTGWARPESGDGVIRFLYVDGAATSVYVVGDWNGWNPTATPLDPVGDGSWLAEVFLDSGTYEYKLLVNGQWVVDADNPEVSSSGNSVVRVGAGGVVMPASTPASGSGEDGESTTVADNVRWSMRYLGYVFSRKDPVSGRYELDRPDHEIDVNLEADIAPDLDAWVLMKLRNLESETDASDINLRFDRAYARWHPGSWDLRLFDNNKATNFDNPGTLVGRIGIYQDPFGYRRRGVLLRQKFAGAPLQFVYTDNTEKTFAEDSLSTGSLFGGPAYATSSSRRGTDTIAFRARGGRADGGIGVSLRHDRGAFAGGLAEVSLGADSLGAVASGSLNETTELWNAWGVDLRTKVAGVRLMAEYLSGNRRARATTTTSVSNIRPDSLGQSIVFGPTTDSATDFELSRSRKVIVQLDGGSRSTNHWNPFLRYEYEEHHQSALVTGTSFLMRRNTLSFGLTPQFGDLKTRLRFEQNWFAYNAASSWETQFWFRRNNPWLDEDVAGLDRFTLLGESLAASVELQLEAPLWKSHGLDGELRWRYAAPGMHRAPQYMETVLRFSLPLRGGFILRTHSRLATYRRFETQDPDVVAALGPGPHIAAGSLAKQAYPDKSYDYKNYAAHFIEVIYAITSRSDISLGFGVDPWVLYRIRNDYMYIGWDQFVFSQGASQADAFADPQQLGARLEQAEGRLESERRLMLEARLRF